MPQPDEFITFLNNFFPEYVDLYTTHQISMETKRALDDVYVLYRKQCHYCFDSSVVLLEQKMCYRCFVESELRQIHDKMDELYNSPKTFEEKFNELASFIDQQYVPMSMSYRREQKEEGLQEWLDKKFMVFYEREFERKEEMDKRIEEEVRTKKRKK